MALKQKDYRAAQEHFERAAPFYGDDKEFNLCFETTRLLNAVRTELAGPASTDKIDIEEVFSDG
ncbi:MAG: hypothetical protein JSW34_02335 [Candidatus Zixiibacteriota bacterium]|nr:MAG: hypothetical protein JSW34_02335 [candidate division Zixibacteria bacterium]